MLLVAAYFAMTFNPNDYKDDIIKLVKDKKERTLHIEGDIKLSYCVRTDAPSSARAPRRHPIPAFVEFCDPRIRIAVADVDVVV